MTKISAVLLPPLLRRYTMTSNAAYAWQAIGLCTRHKMPFPPWVLAFLAKAAAHMAQDGTLGPLGRRNNRYWASEQRAMTSARLHMAQVGNNRVQAAEKRRWATAEWHGTDAGPDVPDKHVLRDMLGQIDDRNARRVLKEGYGLLHTKPPRS